MDDSFAFRTTVPIRRGIDPVRVKLAVFTAIAVTSVGLFASWVVASERESFARTHRRVLPSAAEITGIDDVGGASTDADAEKAIGAALDAARAASTQHRSLLDAGPARLSALEPRYTFVDGPSTTSSIVSVAATAHTWAAAAQASDGACHWVRATSAGGLTRGSGDTGPECTAAAVLLQPPRR